MKFNPEPDRFFGLLAVLCLGVIWLALPILFYTFRLLMPISGAVGISVWVVATAGIIFVNIPKKPTKAAKVGADIQNRIACLDTLASDALQHGDWYPRYSQVVKEREALLKRVVYDRATGYYRWKEAEDEQANPN